MDEQVFGQWDSAAPDFELRTPAAVLRARAVQQGSTLAYTFLFDGETEAAHLTYAELDRRARTIGAALRSFGERGQRALLLYPPGLEYIAALFGCFYAGVIAIPLYPPHLNRHLLRVQSILKDAQATVALTDARSLARLQSLLSQLPELSSIQWLATDMLSREIEDEWNEDEPDGDSVAMLQYTSGSTGQPRGVMLSHRNLAHNSALLARAFDYTSNSQCVSWLPMYHDMGLIGGVIQPLYGGFPCVLMSPASFLQRPFRWLKAISSYRATISGGPNFAFDLCVRRIASEQRASLDLSSWSIAFNGAEPVRQETLQRFAENFEPCGFRSQAFYPCYGLAEATLLVSGRHRSHPPVVKKVDARLLESGRAVDAVAGGERERLLVGSGHTLADERVIVVNPDILTECGQDEVGEVWISSRSVALGYWNRPDETAHTFRAHLSTGHGPFLRTGDLGFIKDGELFITGRLKDLIIIRGRNHYPQDIEFSVERSDTGLRPAAGAAFSIEIDGEERLVIVHEVERRSQADLSKIINRIREVVTENHELQTYAVMLIGAGRIPKTSSGKIQRHACRAEFLSNNLDALAEWRDTLTQEVETPSLISEPASWGREDIEAYLVSKIAARLAIDDVGIDEHQSVAYYGLDSLGAIELSHRIESDLGVVLPVSRLLDGRRITELAADLHDQLRGGQNESDALLAAARKENYSYPLSHGQHALWFLQQTAPESAAYNIASALRIRGDLNRQVLRQVFRRLLDRHQSLRTSFAAINGEPLQTVHRQMDLDFIEEDASSWSEELLSQRLDEEAHRPFNLESDPLLRIRLFTRIGGEQILLLVAHHIALDFWSLGILLRDLERLYVAEKAGNGRFFDLSQLQYADYVRWQREKLSGPEGERLWSYWQKQLAGDLPALNLPVVRRQSPINSQRGASLRFKLSVELRQRLKSLARQQGATLYMLLLAAYQVLLHRYTNQDAIVVGTSAACRGRAELAGIVGYFVNPLVLRVNVAGDESFVSFLDRVRGTVLEAFDHQDYPFPLLVERLQPNRDASRTPIFQVMFVFHKAQRPEEDCLSLLALGEPAAPIKLEELEVESISLEQHTAQFDLTLAMTETENGLSGVFQFSTEVFDAETITRMSKHYRVLLEGIVANPERRLSELPLLTVAEQQQILYEWNETRQPYPSEQCLHQLFEQQCERTPESLALVSGTTKLTYEELNARANQVAQHLLTFGVRAETLVGILMEHSVEMVVSLLGVLKAGAAYVPLDPESPPDRLSLMIEGAGFTVLMTQRRLAGRLSESGKTRIICVDEEWAQIAAQNRNRVESNVNPDNLAYVIHTSGSTGRPKGVMISHRSVVNYLHWCLDFYNVAGGSGAPVHSAIGFDLTVTSLFAPLLAGRNIVLSDAPGVEALTSILDWKSGYSFVKLTPSHLEVLNLAVDTRRAAGLTNVLILGGEALHSERLKPWLRHSPATRIINEYGPTETTVGCCVYEVTRDSTLHGPVPIGRPQANTQAYILDEHQSPVPVGIAGELYVGGLGLARGYLGSPDLTAERFVPHPFSLEPGARLYRTGDRVRYRPDGNMEFLGRFDEQVKLRGYRVEPGEIETVLREHGEIREAVVIADETASGAKLRAYFIPAAKAPTAADLSSYLKAKLPPYMVPTVLVKVDQLPLTPNGKVDRKALRLVESEASGLRPGFTAPRTETERALAEIWSGVLDIQEVGVNDNFFELGGHSLIATQIVSRIRDDFAVDLPLPRFLRSPTVAELAEAIDELKTSGKSTQKSKIAPAARGNYRTTLFEQGATTLSGGAQENLADRNSPPADKV
ncbi:MAG TPA: amino acid adenylation domain-containing protein [Pyrinomonadaceae bacterium]|nr:amino acid adenylation domain-containing protein [Pyrinomonadaceae bacterium]